MSQCNRCLAGTMQVTKKSRRRNGDQVHTLKCDRCGYSELRDIPRAEAPQPCAEQPEK